MSKRSGATPRPPRKKRKGQVSYASVDVDALAKQPFREEIRVWNVTQSETNRRVSATQKIRHHLHAGHLQSSPESQPSAADTEDIDAPVDLEPDEGSSAKLVAKRKKGKVTKENDSVRTLLNFIPT